MKKICTFILALTATTLLNAQSFGILVNGSKYFAGELNTAQTGWTEYMITGVPLAAGDQCVIYDLGNQAGWAEPLDEASTSNLTLNGSSYSVSVAGCYDFYLKMFGFENNQLYVGYAGESGCSDYSTTIGDNPGGREAEKPDNSTTISKSPAWVHLQPTNCLKMACWLTTTLLLPMPAVNAISSLLSLTPRVARSVSNI